MSTAKQPHVMNFKKRLKARHAADQNISKAVEFAKLILVAGVNGKRAIVSIMGQHGLDVRAARRVLKEAQKKSKRGH